MGEEKKPKTARTHVKLETLTTKIQISRKAVNFAFQPLTKHVIRIFSSQPNGTFHSVKERYTSSFFTFLKIII